MVLTKNKCITKFEYFRDTLFVYIKILIVIDRLWNILVLMNDNMPILHSNHIQFKISSGDIQQSIAIEYRIFLENNKKTKYLFFIRKFIR